MTRFSTDRSTILQQFITGICQHVEHSRFEESLQEAIDSVLSGLSDEVKSDLYARIVTGYGLVDTQNALFHQLIEYELRRTNLWGAI